MEFKTYHETIANMAGCARAFLKTSVMKIGKPGKW